MQPKAVTLDTIPILPSAVSVHQFSTHNKKGLNGDAGWCLYKNEYGDSVVFDVVGPGCLRSMWQTVVPEGQILKFYFDGESEPRYAIPSLDFYNGKHPLFPCPFNSYQILGRYIPDAYAANSFVPIPFAKGLKIAVQGELHFFHGIYERYPSGTEIDSFTGQEDRGFILDAFQLHGDTRKQMSEVEVVRVETEEIPQHRTLDLLKVERSGVITKIVIEADGSPTFLNDIQIAMQWDESATSDVFAPIGAFFACPIRAENIQSLPIEVEKLPDGRVRLTCYWRMPFWRKAHVRLINHPSGTQYATGPVKAEIHLAPQSYTEANSGYFSTLYRSGQTEMGRDWLFFEGLGTGWFVGIVQTMLGSHYCEGDEHFTVDGAAMPQINGTGTEDYYLACLWPNPHYTLPFAGCVGDVFIEGGGNMTGCYFQRACYYRFHLEAPIPFYSEIDARIQHGGMSDIVSSYSSLAFCYWRKQVAMVQTDVIDVASPASEAIHGYISYNSTSTGELNASYEGNNLRTIVRDQGRSHRDGTIHFTVTIRPDNAGVRLRRRLDQKSPRQCADVYIDGDFAGTWYHPDENEWLRWFDSEFDIHPKFTRGKEKLEVSLVVKTDAGRGAFTDFRYDVFTYTESHEG